MALAASIAHESLQLMLQFIAYNAQYSDFPKDFAFINQPAGYVPPDKSLAPKVTFYVLAALCSLFVAARIWTRAFYLHVGLWWDDHLMILSLVSTWAWTVLQLLVLYVGGVGRHIYDVDFATLERALALEIWNQIAYLVTVLLIKLSVLFFFLRITPPKPRSFKMRWVIIGTMFFLIINFVVQLLLTVLACKPVQATWNLRVRLADFNCISWYKMLLAFMSIWAFTDVWILLLPIPIVWNLRASLRSKIATLFLFAVGAIACIAAFLKLPYLGGVYDTWDPTWHSVTVIVLYQVEVCFGIIAACMPSLSVWLNPPTDQNTSNRPWRGNPYKQSSDPISTNLSGLDSGDLRYGNGTKTMPVEENTAQLFSLRKSNHVNTEIRALKELPQADTELRLHYPRPPSKSQAGKKLDPPPALWKVDTGRQVQRDYNPWLNLPEDQTLQGRRTQSFHVSNERSPPQVEERNSWHQVSDSASDHGIARTNDVPQQRFYSLDSNLRRQSARPQPTFDRNRGHIYQREEPNQGTDSDDTRSLELVIQRPKSSHNKKIDSGAGNWSG